MKKLRISTPGASIVAMLLLAACRPATEEMTPGKMFSGGKWIDLTYAFSEQTLYWPNNPTGFELNTQFEGTTAGGFYYSSYAFCSPEHGGTHLDAPVHFAEGKWTADQIPVEQLIGEAIIKCCMRKTYPALRI